MGCVQAAEVDSASCGVCGRTILAGETTRDYVSLEGETAGVCQLCKSRAEASGWTRADLPRRPPPTPVLRRRPSPRSIRGRLIGRSRISDRDEGPATPERRIRRALEGFNETDQTRKVAGLTRSLGEPQVGAAPIGPPPEGRVRITVVWELAWYQWEVRITDAGFAVRELAKGDEVEQLAEADRVWNVRADESGDLLYGVAG